MCFVNTGQQVGIRACNSSVSPADFRGVPFFLDDLHSEDQAWWRPVVNPSDQAVVYQQLMGHETRIVARWWGEYHD